MAVRRLLLLHIKGYWNKNNMDGQALVPGFWDLLFYVLLVLSSIALYRYEAADKKKQADRKEKRS